MDWLCKSLSNQISPLYTTTYCFWKKRNRKNCSMSKSYENVKWLKYSFDILTQHVFISVLRSPLNLMNILNENMQTGKKEDNTSSNALSLFNFVKWIEPCDIYASSIWYYRLDVFWGQPIKLIQAVSTSEFHEYWWKDIDFNCLVPWLFAGPQKPQTFTVLKTKNVKFGPKI